jgi:hypothetical protein
MADKEDKVGGKSRDVAHEAIILQLKADAPRVRVRPKGQNTTLSPPTASMGVKAKT